MNLVEYRRWTKFAVRSLALARSLGRGFASGSPGPPWEPCLKASDRSLGPGCAAFRSIVLDVAACGADIRVGAEILIFVSLLRFCRNEKPFLSSIIDCNCAGLSKVSSYRSGLLVAWIRGKCGVRI